MKMLRNKKGLDYYTLIISLVGILILSFVIFNLFSKQLKLSSGLPIGTEQFRILKTYSTGEKILSFVDDSAQLSIEHAAHLLGKSGLFHSTGKESTPCGQIGHFTNWTKDIMGAHCNPLPIPCYPGEGTMKATFIDYFSQNLSAYISDFNIISKDIQIPFSYNPFKLEPVPGRTEVVGISRQPIAIAPPNIKYEVMPNFKESIPIDVITDGKLAVSIAGALSEIAHQAAAARKESESDLTKQLAAVNAGGQLAWDLVRYDSRGGNICWDNTGITCYYDCNCDRDGCERCQGIYEKQWFYSIVNSQFSATEPADGEKLLVQDKNVPELKKMEYDFGLSWIVPKSCIRTCSGNEPEPC